MSDQNSNSPIQTAFQTALQNAKKNPTTFVIALVAVAFFVACFVPIIPICNRCGHVVCVTHDRSRDRPITVWSYMNKDTNR